MLSKHSVQFGYNISPHPKNETNESTRSSDLSTTVNRACPAWMMATSKMTFEGRLLTLFVSKMCCHCLSMTQGRRSKASWKTESLWMTTPACSLARVQHLQTVCLQRMNLMVKVECPIDGVYYSTSVPVFITNTNTFLYFMFVDLSCTGLWSLSRDAAEEVKQRYCSMT